MLVGNAGTVRNVLIDPAREGDPAMLSAVNALNKGYGPPGRANQGGLLWREVTTVAGVEGWLQEEFLLESEP